MSLTINRHIVRQDWMMSSETETLFRALQGSVPQEEPQALFVGGCVRNAVLGEDVDDFDVATPLQPEDVVSILEKEGIKVIPTGIDHGTVTAILGDLRFEITTLREDKDTDGRHAVVSYTTSWEEDARRRDFTINTLLLDLKGNIYDPLGTGLKDIDERLVRFVGEADQRIKEDYLRILRFFRFSAIYGNGNFDKDGLIACRNNADSIVKLSKERITQEFFKILASDEPYKVLDTMYENEVLKDLKFDEYDPEFFEYFCNFQKKYKVSALWSRIFVFAGMNLDNIAAMEKYILFPKVFLKDMRSVLGSLNLSDLSEELAVKESVYRYGRAITAQALMIELVQDRVINVFAPKALDIIQNWDVPDFPVTGEDLIKEGMKPGPELGEELERRETEWIKGGF